MAAGSVYRSAGGGQRVDGIGLYRVREQAAAAAARTGAGGGLARRAASLARGI